MLCSRNGGQDKLICSSHFGNKSILTKKMQKHYIVVIKMKKGNEKFEYRIKLILQLLLIKDNCKQMGLLR